MDYAAKCKEYLHVHHIKAEQIVSHSQTRTAAEAAVSLGVGIERIVKTVVLAVDTGFIAIVLRGMDKVDLGAVRTLLDTGKVRMATREEVLTATGYPAGGVPPLGHGLTLYIDQAVMETDEVFAGGGSESTMLKIAPKELLRASNAVIAALSQRKP